MNGRIFFHMVCRISLFATRLDELLTFRVESGLSLILEHLHIIEVLMHANATIMFKDNRCSL